VRGGIVDVFSPLYRDPIRFELEEDTIISLRRFEASSQRSLNEMAEAIIVRTRLVPPPMLKNDKLRERVALRCAEIGLVRKETAEFMEALEAGLLFPGAELLLPYLFDRPLDSLFDYIPS